MESSPQIIPDPTRTMGLYLHIPFCATRCSYCDFNTYSPAQLDHPHLGNWVDYLIGELILIAPRINSIELSTIFIGGGTPSLLGARGLCRLIEVIRDHYPCSPEIEITTEANPESTNQAFFDELIDRGFTRISMGMQAYNPTLLTLLGRTHEPQRPLQAISQARQAGFQHLNLDLIYGIPGETLQDLHQCLQLALDSGIDHLSAYALTIEPATPLGRQLANGQLRVVDDDQVAQRYEFLEYYLHQHGFDWYEISNWSRTGGRCRHNWAYWTGGQYWGIGPGAHSHIGTWRYWNIKHPHPYQERIQAGHLGLEGYESLRPDQIHLETLMLGLRTRQGIPLSLLTEDQINQAQFLCQQGLVECDHTHLRLLLPGRLIANRIIELLSS